MTQRAQLAETRALKLTEAEGDGTRFRARLITPGWGSSGYYSPQVVENAATNNIWPAGTHMYLDHPSASEDRDRPERSVKHWAAVLESDGEWNGEGVDADIRVFSDYAEFVRERADVLGLSIRASGHIEMGEAEGRKGRIITELVEAQSVDFVTRAGRGGKILQLLESALPSEVAQRATQRAVDVDEATANDIQDRLRGLLRDAYGNTDDPYVYVWLRDFDPDAQLAWYEVEGGDDNGLYQHAYTSDDAGVLALTGTPAPVRVETRYVPVNPAGQPTSTEESSMPQIEEGRLAQLETDAGRVPTLESERDTERQARTVAEAELARLRARDTARPIVTAAIGESRLLRRVPATAARVTESLLAALPFTDGKLDENALRENAAAARQAAETELAEALAAAGAGTPRDLGGDDDTSTVTEADGIKAARAAFGHTETGA